MQKGHYWDFFLAHSNADSKAAEILHDLLAPYSDVFLDTRCLRPGDYWDEELMEAQKTSSISVVLISSNTDEQFYLRDEIVAAIELAKKDKNRHRVVPVYLEGCDSERTPRYGLRIKHGLHVDRLGGIHNVAQHLLGLISSKHRNKKTVIYSERLEAAHRIRTLIANEPKRLWIVAGSLGGSFDTYIQKPLADRSNNLDLRVLLAHPQFMRERSRWEGRQSSIARTFDRVHVISEGLAFDSREIRIYNFYPSCTAFIAEELKRAIVNPYPLTGTAAQSLTIDIDGQEYPEAFNQFHRVHAVDPWNNNQYSMSLDRFIVQYNNNIIHEIASEIIKICQYIKDKNTPKLIAINGITGAGKTELAENLRRILSEPEHNLACSTLETDGWLKTSRSQRQELGLTGFNDEAYDLSSLFDTIKSVSKGEPYNTRVYDHERGVASEGETQQATDIVIVEGLMSTHPVIYNLYSLSFWLTCRTVDIHQYLRVKRDVEKRSFNNEEAEKNWQLHEQQWPEFERRFRPVDAKEIGVNRLHMLLL